MVSNLNRAGGLLIAVVVAGRAATFTVTTPSDSGAGSLRQAIIDANTTPGADLITFDLPGEGIRTIAPLSQFPDITDPVTIDATTEPGYAGTPLIELNAGFRRRVDIGLHLVAGNSTIRGLAINSFGQNGSGVGIKITGPGGNTVSGCFIGSDPAGLTTRGLSGPGILIENTSGNLIGGLKPQERNLLAGIDREGLKIVGADAKDNRIQGNIIGMNLAGDAVLRNGSGGDLVIEGASNNLIGGIVAGARNLFGGGSTRISIIGPGATGNKIQGNWVGVKSDGGALFASPGSGSGVSINEAQANLIGGVEPGAGNVLSGTQAGVDIIGMNATGNLIQGNFIGTDPAGTLKNANHRGVFIAGGASGNIVGGSIAGAGNLISGNRTDGVSINNSSGNTIQGNLIGTDASGNRALGNGQDGISIGATTTGVATNNVVGGTTVEVRNVISGNGEDGVTLGASNTEFNTIQGNHIGVGTDGSTPLGNGGRGVVTAGVHRNLIGGDKAEAGNIIAHNGLAGVWLAATFGAFGNAGTNNLVKRNTIHSNNGPGVDLRGANVISENSIYNNIGIGIDRMGDGPTPNTPDGTANSPELESAVQGSTVVRGEIKGVPGCCYHLEFFASPPTDLSGSARRFIGSLNVCIDLDGTSPPFVFTSTVTEPTGTTITATATSVLAGIAPFDPCTPETSELSARVVVQTANTSVEFEADTHEVGEGNVARVKIVRSGDVSNVSRIFVSNGTGTAIVGQDFPFFEKEVVFAAGEKEKTVEVPTTEDTTNEDTEEFQLILGSIDGTPLGPRKVTRVIIKDNDGVMPVFQPFTTANHLFASVANDPISTFTGELFNLFPPDLILGGPMILLFQRYYASMIKRDSRVAGRLGDNWLHNFEMVLTEGNATIEIVNQLGRVIPFAKEADGFRLTGEQDIPFQLVRKNGQFILGDPRSQRLYSFDSTGKLLKIEDAHGNTHVLGYQGNDLVTVSDGLGRTLTFEYGASGLLAKVSDGPRTIQFTQSGTALTSVRDALGQETTYTYDTANANAGLLTAMSRPEGNTPFTQSFDQQGRVVSQTEAATGTTTVSYSGLETTVTDPLGHSHKDVHTQSGELLSFTDPTGKTIAVGSNPIGQRATISDRLGQTITIAYHAPSGYPAEFKLADGTVLSLDYSSRVVEGITFYDLQRITYSDSTTESFTYDDMGNLATRTDRAGEMWQFTHNNRGQVLTVSHPGGGLVTLTYHENGTLASRQDLDTGKVTFIHDNLSRLVELMRPDGATLKLSYNANDRLISVTDESGHTSTFGYDKNDRLTTAADASGQITRFQYDARDRVLQFMDRLGKSRSFKYDSRGELASITDGNGNTVQFAYDDRHRLVSRVDPAGKTWAFGYDEEGILISQANPLGQTTTFRASPLGYPSTATDPLGNSWNVTRDPMHRVAQITDPLSRRRRFNHDPRGLVTAAEREGIGSASYQRDALGDVTQIMDPQGSIWKFELSLMGRLKAMIDPVNRATRFEYDSQGRMAKVTFADGVTETMTYDPSGNLIRRQFSEGTDLKYEYDALDRLISANAIAFSYDSEGRVIETRNLVASSATTLARPARGGGGGSAPSIYGAAYDAGGRLTSVSYDQGALVVSYSYDTRDRLIQVKESLTGAQVDFSYDDAGRMTAIQRGNSVNAVWTYDAAGRITRIQDGTFIDMQYTFDAASQITSVNFKAPLDPADFTSRGEVQLTYDAAHQINTSGYAYDMRGRLVTAPGHTFAYNGASWLTRIDAVELSYNGLGDIITRVEGSMIRYEYHYALGLKPIVAERDGSTGRVLRYYVWTPSGSLLFLVEPANGNAVAYYHFATAISTLALTDKSGSITDAYAYSPYGELLAHDGISAQPFTFVGRYGVRAEPAGNLYHMRARYYHPASGRFLSRDPVWPVLSEPQSLNPYQYAFQAPLQFMDPTGKQNEDLHEVEGAHECSTEGCRINQLQMTIDIKPLESELPAVFPEPEEITRLRAATQEADPNKVFAYGVRNSFGMAFDASSGNLWNTENADDSFTEMNLVTPSANSSWRQIKAPLAGLILSQNAHHDPGLNGAGNTPLTLHAKPNVLIAPTISDIPVLGFLFNRSTGNRIMLQPRVQSSCRLF